MLADRTTRIYSSHPWEASQCVKFTYHPLLTSRVPRTANGKKARSARAKAAASATIAKKAGTVKLEDGGDHDESNSQTDSDHNNNSNQATTPTPTTPSGSNSADTSNRPLHSSPIQPHRIEPEQGTDILTSGQVGDKPQSPMLPFHIPAHLLPQAMQMLQQTSLIFSQALPNFASMPVSLPYPDSMLYPPNRPPLLDSPPPVRAPLIFNVKPPEEVVNSSLRGIGIDTVARRVHGFLDNYSRIHVFHWGWGNDVSDVSPNEDTLAAEQRKNPTMTSTPVDTGLLTDIMDDDIIDPTLTFTDFGERIIPIDALDSLIDTFFEHIHPQLPCAFVHEPTFRANVLKQRPLLLNAMYAVAARFSKHPALRMATGSENQAGEVFYQRAKTMVAMNVDAPNLDSVCSLILLAVYAIGTGPDPSGSVSGAWMYSGMAMRMAMFLDLNIDPDSDEAKERNAQLPWLLKERRRRVWWACYIFDRYAAWGADRPTLVDERLCAGVHLPAPEGLWLAASPSDLLPPSINGTHPQPTSKQQQQKSDTTRPINKIRTVSTFHALTPDMDSLFARHVLLMRIVPKVLKFVQTFKNPQPRHMGSMADVEEEDLELLTLDASLRTWYEALPRWMRDPGVSFGQNLDSSNPPAWHLAFLLMLHSASIILLYQPRMMLDLQSPPRGGPAASPAFQTCETAAIRAFAMITAVSASNPDWKYLSAWTPFLLYHIGLINVIAARVHPDESRSTMARYRLRLHVKALKRVGRYWAFGRRMGLSLERMLVSVEPTSAEADAGTNNTGGAAAATSTASAAATSDEPTAGIVPTHDTHDTAVKDVEMQAPPATQSNEYREV
ncbi:hypothetical protein SmJEL517_g00920 [Synchytrium microbalum]|uniref:Xylanolytic transcriptional activator regulatory domain-containing protein n=1 Tax=Synchytrium microbalum TaxID=1806994 RepID=A0A507CBU6_9FUNG|nr:uncharacterized protein SmJEL517_g00920 [Synchytrium microbalum]TPX37092.1 hypothetical protein SmJEL517_g00920 [Synchytrium microbalum]